MGNTTPRMLIDTARQQGRDTAIPPVAVSVSLLPGYDPADDMTLLEPSMLLAPCPHPVLEAFLDTSGATRRGRMSWVVGLGEEYNAAPLDVLFNRLLRGTLLAEADAVTRRGPKDLHDLYAGSKANRVHTLLSGTRAAHTWQDVCQAVAHQHPTEGPGRFGGVTLSGDGRVLWVKVVTHGLTVPEHLPQVPLNLRPAGRTFTDPRPVRPAEAIAVLDWLVSEGVTLVDHSGVNALAVIRDRVSRSVIATPAPGRPALADTSVGRAVFRLPDVALSLPAPGAAESASRGRMSAEDVVALGRGLPKGTVVIHPGTADTGAMALAEPVDDGRLRDYQREAVGLHLATDIGYLQACAPGMGKTVMQLTAMRLRAANRPAYRGVVVAEANVRAQWVSEAAEWFPEAVVVAVESRSDAAKLAEAMLAHDRPVIAVISYGLLAAVTEEVARRDALTQDTTVPATPVQRSETTALEVLIEVIRSARMRLPDGQLALFSDDLSTVVSANQEAVLSTDAPTAVEDDEPVAQALGALLLDTEWHDIAADEAEVLRSTGSKQATALWTLRGRAQVATALTGTPINRSVDDLGRLVSWVRNDEHLFHGVRLSKQFDLDTDEGMAEFRDAMGPLMFRRDSSEIADEIPEIVPEVFTLAPSAEEKALANAARAELKRVYLELLAWLETVEAAEPERRDDPEFIAAREALKEARGAWLGGTTLAQMASSDPAALLDSTSAGAALLAGQGLIEAATAQPGTKRTFAVARVADEVAKGERVLIFTGWATVAKGLIEDLDAAGVRVGAVLGGGGRQRDRMIAQFQRGELDVLVCTSAGERGLNLQQATMIVHYDLPWTPKGIIQRTGRAQRIKSQNKILQVVFLLMEGTIEVDVAAMVVSRAIEAMRALDASRGVDTTRTEMGQALGGLVTAVAESGRGGKNADMMAMTAALVG